MALSNKHGGLVLATGNKSEMSVGYSTLYGDMVGGFAVLKDVSKTLVYELARWRNRGRRGDPRGHHRQAAVGRAAPQPAGHRQPAARTTCSTAILEAYVEQDLAVDDIVKRGFDRAVVERVARMVDRNEYKRRQSAPGREDHAQGPRARPPPAHHQRVRGVGRRRGRPGDTRRVPRRLLALAGEGVEGSAGRAYIRGACGSEEGEGVLELPSRPRHRVPAGEALLREAERRGGVSSVAATATSASDAPAVCTCRPCPRLLPRGRPTSAGF